MGINKDKQLLDDSMGRSIKMSVGEREKLIDEAKASFSSINESLTTIGKNYIKCIFAGEEHSQAFKEAFPDIPNYKWELFELVGMEKIAPGLVIYGGTGFNLIKRLPIKEQEKILSKPIDVLIIGKDGNVDTLKAEFKSLSFEQQKQVVAYDHIRGLSEQRTYIESIRTNDYIKTKTNKNKNYIQRGGKVKFASIWFTEQEVMSMALEITGRKK